MENKQRIIQELVPGKQITLAHIIANPDPILYQKLGLNPAVEYAQHSYYGKDAAGTHIRWHHHHRQP